MVAQDKICAENRRSADVAAQALALFQLVGFAADTGMEGEPGTLSDTLTARVGAGPQGIRVNTVTAGAIYFPGGVWHQREQDTPDFFNKVVAHCPMGRPGRPKEVARAAVFSASAAASYTSPGPTWWSTGH